MCADLGSAGDQFGETHFVLNADQRLGYQVVGVDGCDRQIVLITQAADFLRTPVAPDWILEGGLVRDEPLDRLKAQCCSPLKFELPFSYRKGLHTRASRSQTPLHNA